MGIVKIAIAKGRTEDQAINLLDKAGIDSSILRTRGGNLYLASQNQDWNLSC